MRPGIWIREAVEDTGSGASRPWVWGAILFLIVSVLAAWDLWSIARVSAAASDFRDSGSSVWITENTDGIDRQTCDGLAELDGINSAGAIATSANTRLSIMPNTPIPTYRVSPGFAKLLLTEEQQQAHPGILISEDLADTIQAEVGSTLESAAGPITFDAVYQYPSDGRLASLQSAILIVDGTSSVFDSCWYDVWPFNETAASIGILAANDPSAADRSQLNARNGIEYDVSSQLEAMNTGLLFAGAALLSALVGWAAVRTRRSELASTLHSNVARVDLIVIVIIETVLWSVPALAAVWVGSTFASSALPPGPVMIDSAATGIAAVALAGVLAGAITAASTVRSSRLFNYLRDRR